MADADLPVFSFRPNRAGAISERVSFLTNVLRAPQGAEQRRALRPTPRRSFESDFLLTQAERTFWHHFQDAFGGMEVMIPLYWEVVSLSHPLGGATVDRINFDTTNREWPYFAGGLALLVGRSALHTEVVEIEAVDANGIDLAQPVVSSWGRGTKLYPLRRGVVDSVGELGHKSAAVAITTAQFRLTSPNPWTPAMGADPIYLGKPVFTEEPNWSDDLPSDIAPEVVTLDRQTGRTHQVNPLGRVFVGQQHRWFLNGRERAANFRDLIYRNAGRLGSFWLPSFKADFKLVADVAGGSNVLVVENTGFRYTGGPKPGREHLAIRHEGGTIFRRITAVQAGTTAQSERLVLDAPVGLALSTGQVRKISFMDTARFDTDDFEFIHHAGVDGLHECTAMFRSFADVRTAPEPIHYPIPEGAFLPRPCGENNDLPPTYYEVVLVGNTWGSDTGRIGYPRLGRRLVTNNTWDQNFICRDPAWSGGDTLYYTILAADVTEEFIQFQIQGWGGANCPAINGTYWGAFKCYVKGDTWPDYRLCPATKVGWGRQLDAYTLELESGNFPDEGRYSVFSDYYDERWVV